jgi:predicted SprT family Zn-dependent metalloprotease
VKIPTRFKLLGHTVEVSYDPQQFYARGNHGCSNFEGKYIKLVPVDSTFPVTQSSVEHTFLHELVHMCLYHTEQTALNDNEKFVDLLAGLLHQALTTMEYDDSIQDRLD